ncbi:MAG: hypothetical protein M3P44_13800 [Actinomycetota bacterium]|nr:hypothetical protein [Actinomycetota bacterium]
MGGRGRSRERDVPVWGNDLRPPTEPLFPQTVACGAVYARPWLSTGACTRYGKFTFDMDSQLDLDPPAAAINAQFHLPEHRV